jgi:peptidoglycan/LPS O-acetylase OafA/YrhL
LLYVGVVFATAVFASASIVDRSSKVRSLLTPQTERNGCLDGLRGLLALGVFIHHSFTAYGYFTRGQWVWSSSALFNQLGQSSVSMFFMLTGFLFSQRLLKSTIDGRAVRWSELYVSRFARLVPLYAVIVSAAVLSAFALSGWTLHEPLSAIGVELADWYLFVIPGRPDINLLPQTATLIAGVNWSLKYEWYFYFALPLLYWPLRLCMGPRGTRLAILSFVLVLLIGVISRREILETRLYLLHFGSGTLAALIYRDPTLRRLISSRIFQVMATLAVLLLASLPNSHSTFAVGLTFAFFLAVLGGYDIAGLLKRPAIIWLGEISYGLYLMHGLIIFWTLHYLRESGFLSEMGLLSYTLIVAAIGVLVTAAASIAYIYLEKPSINWGKSLATSRSWTALGTFPQWHLLPNTHRSFLDPEFARHAADRRRIRTPHPSGT